MSDQVDSQHAWGNEKRKAIQSKRSLPPELCQRLASAKQKECKKADAQRSFAFERHPRCVVAMEDGGVEKSRWVAGEENPQHSELFYWLARKPTLDPSKDATATIAVDPHHHILDQKRNSIKFNVWHNRAAAVDAPLENALSAAPRSCHCYATPSTRR